jgi:hypothetical protein
VFVVASLMTWLCTQVATERQCVGSISMRFFVDASTQSVPSFANPGPSVLPGKLTSSLFEHTLGSVTVRRHEHDIGNGGNAERGLIPSSRHLYRPRAQGREVGRSAGDAADQVRVRNQLANCPDAWHRGAADAACHRRRGYRMTRVLMRRRATSCSRIKPNRKCT